MTNPQIDTNNEELFENSFHEWLELHGVNLGNEFDGSSFDARVNLNKLKASLLARDQQIALAAQINGMEKAKSRVLRRTEIPEGAKNPTRDIVVVVGEECARIIDKDIATLKAQEKS